MRRTMPKVDPEGSSFPGLRYAVGTVINGAGRWHWFVVGIDEVRLLQYYRRSDESFPSEEMAFAAGRTEIDRLTLANRAPGMTQGAPREGLPPPEQTSSAEPQVAPPRRL
jgi:hypothetical protein